MAATPQMEEIARRYGLEPIPDSVRRLTQMVANRDSSTDEFAVIISKDKDLSARVLKAANPRAADESEYTATTVEEVLMRTGLGMAFLVAMSDPLFRAVQKTFHTMLSIQLKTVPAATLETLKGEHVSGAVHFKGKATGLVQLRISKPAAAKIAAGILGIDPSALGGPEEINDVIGELTNMVTGNFKSNLCDANLACELSPPKILRTSDCRLSSAADSPAERTGFFAPELSLIVDLSVNPWTG